MSATTKVVPAVALLLALIAAPADPGTPVAETAYACAETDIACVGPHPCEVNNVNQTCFIACVGGNCRVIVVPFEP